MTGAGNTVNTDEDEELVEEEPVEDIVRVTNPMLLIAVESSVKTGLKNAVVWIKVPPNVAITATLPSSMELLLDYPWPNDMCDLAHDPAFKGVSDIVLGQFQETIRGLMMDADRPPKGNIRVALPIAVDTNVQPSVVHVGMCIALFTLPAEKNDKFCQPQVKFQANVQDTPLLRDEEA